MNKFIPILFASLLLSSCSYIAKHPDLVNEVLDIEREMIDDNLNPKAADEKASDDKESVPAISYDIDRDELHNNISKYQHKRNGIRLG